MTLLNAIINNELFGILKAIKETNVKSQEFTIALRYVVETRNAETLSLMFQNKSIADIDDKKIILLAAEGPLKIFKKFKHLFKESFAIEAHPLIHACAVENTEVVKFIVNGLRGSERIKDKETNQYNFIKLGLFPPISNTSNPLEDLISFAIKISARRGCVSILNILCNNRKHVHNAIASMLTNGKHHCVPYMLSNPELDFAHNNFELLKLCSLHIGVLMNISRHHTVCDAYDKLPADYYRHAVDAAKLDFQKRIEREKNKHVDKVRRTTSLVLTNAKPESRKHKSARTGHHLSDVINHYHASNKTESDLTTLVTGIHIDHKGGHERLLREKNLVNFRIE